MVYFHTGFRCPCCIGALAASTLRLWSCLTSSFPLWRWSLSPVVGSWRFIPRRSPTSGEIMSLGAAAETSSWLSGVRHRALIPLWTSAVGEIVWAYRLLVRRCSPFSCVVLSSFFFILLVLTLASFLASLSLAFCRGSCCRRSCHGIGLSSSPSLLVVLVATRGEFD